MNEDKTFVLQKMQQLKDLLDKDGSEDEISDICCELFIDDSGGNNWMMINSFTEYAPEYSIVCVERDSFSWLVAGIKKGETIVATYG